MTEQPFTAQHGLSSTTMARITSGCLLIHYYIIIRAGSFVGLRLLASAYPILLLCCVLFEYLLEVTLAVGETVILMTPPLLSRLKHLMKVEGGAVE